QVRRRVERQPGGQGEILRPRLLLQDAEVVRVEQVPHPSPSRGRSADRRARPYSTTSAKAGSSLKEPVHRSTHLPPPRPVANRRCNSATAASTAASLCSINASTGIAYPPFVPWPSRFIVPRPEAVGNGGRSIPRCHAASHAGPGAEPRGTRR